jgi:hypothetical protein
VGCGGWGQGWLGDVWINWDWMDHPTPGWQPVCIRSMGCQVAEEVGHGYAEIAAGTTSDQHMATGACCYQACCTRQVSQRVQSVLREHHTVGWLMLLGVKMYSHWCQEAGRVRVHRGEAKGRLGSLPWPLPIQLPPHSATPLCYPTLYDMSHSVCSV